MTDKSKIIEVLERDNAFAAEGPLAANTAEALHTVWPAAYPLSACALGGRVFVLVRKGAQRMLAIITPQGNTCEMSKTGFEPEQAESVTVGEKEYLVAMCPCSAENTDALRAAFPFTRQRPGGLESSFGFGDRLGIATPGHIRAASQFHVFPVFAQQSIREMERTGRSPRQVLGDAAWCVFQEGFRTGYGADADHLKTEDDVRATAEAGFTMFTIDPSEHLVNSGGMDTSTVTDELMLLFAEGDQPNDDVRNAFISEYANKTFDLEDPDTGFRHTFAIQSLNLVRTAVMYLPAVRHTVKLYNLLRELKGGEDFDFEVSIDETDLPTTPEGHLFVINELNKAGVRVTSLAPRFVGEFQKGIDYIGDVDELRESMKLHALIARAMGPYKLSIHSGSDKFSVFPIVGELTRGLLHEKTAGTSYLEAVRVISRRDPALYRDIHKFALDRFETDRASYHVTTDLSAIPALDTLSDDQLPSLMDEINPRQLIHITYGSVLTAKDEQGNFIFYDRFMDALRQHEEEHYDTVAAHFVKHCESLQLKRKQEK